MEDAGEQSGSRNYDHLKPWQFKPGQSGNPSGRKPGSISLKEWVRKMLYEMTDEERIEFLKGMDKKVLWEMSEGKADAKVETDLTSGGKPIPLMFNVLTDNKPQENSSTE